VERRIGGRVNRTIHLTVDSSAPLGTTQSALSAVRYTDGTKVLIVPLNDDYEVKRAQRILDAYTEPDVRSVPCLIDWSL